MKKFLLCTVLLSASLLTACGSRNEKSQSTTEYAIEDVILEENGTLSEADKQRKYLAYLENYLEEDVLKSLSEVKSASVTLNAPEDADIGVNSEEEIAVNVILDLEDELSTYSAGELADMIAKGLGNATTDDIMILDTDGSQLFPEK